MYSKECTTINMQQVISLQTRSHIILSQAMLEGQALTQYRPELYSMSAIKLRKKKLGDESRPHHDSPATRTCRHNERIASTANHCTDHWPNCHDGKSVVVWL